MASGVAMIFLHFVYTVGQKGCMGVRLFFFHLRRLLILFKGTKGNFESTLRPRSEGIKNFRVNSY